MKIHTVEQKTFIFIFFSNVSFLSWNIFSDSNGFIKCIIALF